MKAQQEYESLTERIEAQKEKKMNRFIAALAAVIQESDEEPAKDTSSEIRTMSSSSLFRCFPFG